MRSIIPNTKASDHCHRRSVNNCLSRNTEKPKDVIKVTTAASGRCTKTTKWKRVCKGVYFCFRAVVCEMMMVRLNDSGVQADRIDWRLGLRVWYWCLISLVEVGFLLGIKLRQRQSNRGANPSSLYKISDISIASEHIPDVATIASSSDFSNNSPHGNINTIEYPYQDDLTEDHIPSSPLIPKTLAIQSEQGGNGSFMNVDSNSTDARDADATNSHSVLESRNASSEEIAARKRKRIPTQFYSKGMALSAIKPSAMEDDATKLVANEICQKKLTEKRNTPSIAERYTAGKRKRIPTQFYSKGMATSAIKPTAMETAATKLDANESQKAKKLAEETNSPSIAEKNTAEKRKRIPTQFYSKGMATSAIKPTANETAAAKLGTNEKHQNVKESTRENIQSERTTIAEVPNSWKRIRFADLPDTRKKTSSFVTVTEIVGRENPPICSTQPRDRPAQTGKTTAGRKRQRKITPRWEAKFRLLLEYKRKFKHTRVPQHSVEYRALAIWVKDQRYRYSKGKIQQEKIDTLESIGFEWDPGKEEWMKNYYRLVAYKRTYGTTRVPQEWKKDSQLARWVKNQQQRCNMEYRIDLLNEIDFVWQA